MSLRKGNDKCKNCGDYIVLITQNNDYMGRAFDVEPHWVHGNYHYSRRCVMVAEPIGEPFWKNPDIVR